MSRRTIRRARPADAPALTGCIDAAYASFRAEIADLPDVSRGVAEDIASHDVWVAVSDDAIVGGLILRISGSEAHLANLAVDPAHCGAGHGRALIATAEEFARAKGCLTMALATHVLMQQNVRLYERLGWKVAESAGSRVFMVKRL